MESMKKGAPVRSLKNKDFAFFLCQALAFPIHPFTGGGMNACLRA
jgi:hypothetical protein